MGQLTVLAGRPAIKRLWLQLTGETTVALWGVHLLTEVHLHRHYLADGCRLQRRLVWGVPLGHVVRFRGHRWISTVGPLFLVRCNELEGVAETHVGENQRGEGGGFAGRGVRDWLRLVTLVPQHEVRVEQRIVAEQGIELLCNRVFWLFQEKWQNSLSLFARPFGDRDLRNQRRTWKVELRSSIRRVMSWELGRVLPG